jgi:hypothetical protein
MRTSTIQLRNMFPNSGILLEILAVNAVQWDDVTLGALASQMSGIGRDCKLLKLVIHSVSDLDPRFRAG